LLSTELIFTLPSLELYSWSLDPLPLWLMPPKVDEVPPPARLLPLLPSRLSVPLLKPLFVLLPSPPMPVVLPELPELPKLPAVLPMLLALALSALPSVPELSPGPTLPPLSPPLPALLV
jgi:hypothetical protein